MVRFDELDDLSPPPVLLGIWPHPDDEAYLSAGLMMRTIERGGRVVCRYATRGELGTDDPVAWPPARMAGRRERELRTALGRIGVHDIGFLGHRDGGCADVDPIEAAASIADMIDEVRPDMVVTFGPDGITGHPDHTAVSRWVLGAVRLVRTRHGVAPDVLLATMTESFLARNEDLHRRLGVFSYGPAVASCADDIVVSVVLDERELDLKRRVLVEHHSQTDPLVRLMGPEQFRRWWDVETFRAPTPDELTATRRRGPDGAELARAGP